MAVLLFMVYATGFIMLIAGLIKCRNSEFSWNSLLGLELAAIAVAVAAYVIFERLPGKGIMPGLTYMGETMYSIGAIVVYTILFFVTVFMAPRE